MSPVGVGGAAALLGATSGVYCGCLPRPACAAYGIDAPSPSTISMCRVLGGTNVAFSMLALTSLKGLAAGSAMRVAWAPLLLATVLESINMRSAPLLLAASATAGSLVACGKLGCASLCSTLALLLGLLAALVPRQAAAALGGSADDGAFIGMCQNVGNQLCALAVLQLLLTQGVFAAATTAIGCGWAVALVGLLHMTFVCNAHAAMGVSKEGTAYPWLIVQPVIIAFSLL